MFTFLQILQCFDYLFIVFLPKICVFRLFSNKWAVILYANGAESVTLLEMCRMCAQRPENILNRIIRSEQILVINEILIICLDEEVQDANTIFKGRNNKVSQHKFYIQTEEGVPLKKQFLLHLANSENTLVGDFSGSQILVFDISSASLTQIQRS